MKTYRDVLNSFYYQFFINYIYKILIIFYPIKIINKENIYNDNKSCIAVQHSQQELVYHSSITYEAKTGRPHDTCATIASNRKERCHEPQA